MKIIPLTGSIGAEVTDIDLKTLDNETSQRIEEAFAEHLVLVFREQTMTPGDLMALTNHFGGPGETPYLQGLPDYPDVVPVIKEADEKSQHSFGAGWHTDFTFQERPPARTLLYAVDTPPSGGDTLYANQYIAYDALSQGMQSSLENLRAVHSAVRSYGPRATLRNHMEHMTITNDTEEPEIQTHPVIRKHPVTARPALWVNPTYTIRFEDMTEQESNTLLKYLNSLIASPGHCCRVRWQPGTLTMWDNRCTQHCATSDYRGHRREMWRTTTMGEIPSAYRKDC